MTQTVDRTKFIGGTDVAAILGLSRYRTPVDVWAEKTGKVAREDLSKKLPIRLGHKLEPVIAELFCEETGFEVRRVKESYVHKVIPFFQAQVDRLVLKDGSVLECKSAHSMKAAEWKEDEVPLEYLTQGFAQLAVTGKSHCWIACLIGGNADFVYKKIERDESVIKDIEDRVTEFWERFIVKDVMPDTSFGDSGTLLKLFPSSQEIAINLDEAHEKLAARYKEIGTEGSGLLGELLREKDEVGNKLRAALGDAGAGLTPSYKITWNSQSTGVRLDLKRIKAEEPGIFEKYGEAGNTRVLRVSENKPDKLKKAKGK